MSFQEVGIALLGERGEHYRELRNFVLALAAFSSAALAIVAYSPLVTVWYRDVAGLPPELIELALTPTRMMVILPAITVLISFQRALLINARNTSPLGGATLTEIAGIATVLFVGIWWYNMIGVYVAALALVVGRLLGNIYLVPAVWRLLKERGIRV
jgi:O-antigen/teichoic acid export membrane protein